MEQTAMETDAPAEPAAEVEEEQNLDDVLNEWASDEKTEETTQKVTTTLDEKSLQEMRDLHVQVKFEMERRMASEAAQEFNGTVKSLIGDQGWPEILVKGFLNQKAMDDEKLKHAYLNKHENPSAWKRVEKALRKEIGEMFSQIPSIDASATKRAISSAVRNVKTTAPDGNVDLSTLNDTDFAKYKKKMFQSL